MIYAWEQRTLNEAADFFNEKRVPIDAGLRTSGEYPYYGATGIIDYVDGFIFDGEFVLLAEDGSNIINRNSSIAYLTQGKFWLNNHAHIMKMKQGDNGFLLQLLEKQSYISLNTGTAQPKLNGEVVKKMSLIFPCAKEQTRIGQFFRTLDNTIAIHKHKLDGLRKMKKAYLQVMFPQTGEAVPKMRFGGFTNEWKEIPLGTILTERKQRQKITDTLPLLAFAAGQGVIDRSERRTNNRDFLTHDAASKVYLLTHKDDIVYNPSNLKYGAIDRNKHGSGVISPIYITFETSEIPSFVELIVTSEAFKDKALQYEEGTVTKRQSVKPEMLLTLTVMIPTNHDEQSALGNFFCSIDKQVTNLTNKIEQLTMLKNAYLKKMFV